MKINVQDKSERASFAFLSACTGGLASMAFLRIFNDWAFTTEFKWHAALTAIHSCLVFVFMVLWFGNLQTNLTAGAVLKRGLGAALIGGLLAILALPYGFVLIMSGQAFVTSCVATAVYIAIALQKDG